MTPELATRAVRRCLSRVETGTGQTVQVFQPTRIVETKYGSIACHTWKVDVSVLGYRLAA